MASLSSWVRASAPLRRDPIKSVTRRPRSSVVVKIVITTLICTTYSPDIILKVANRLVRRRLFDRLAESLLQFFGSIKVLPMRLEQWLPDMDVVPRVWVPGSDGSTCSSGMALYMYFFSIYLLIFIFFRILRHNFNQHNRNMT